jgi:hypothetical protein
MENKMKNNIPYNSYTEKGILHMQCKVCGEYVPNVGEKAIAVQCDRCTFNKVRPLLPKEKKYEPTGRPQGWHWMGEFVDKDGNVFHRGKEQPKLKGTLKPTKVKPPKKRKVKRRTKEEILAAQYRDKKKKLREARKKQEDFLNHKFDDE